MYIYICIYSYTMCIHIYIYFVNTWYFIANILKGYATSLYVAIAGVCSLPVVPIAVGDLFTERSVSRVSALQCARDSCLSARR